MFCNTGIYCFLVRDDFMLALLGCYGIMSDVIVLFSEFLSGIQFFVNLAEALGVSHTRLSLLQKYELWFDRLTMNGKGGSTGSPRTGKVVR